MTNRSGLCLAICWHAHGGFPSCDPVLRNFYFQWGVWDLSADFHNNPCRSRDWSLIQLKTDTETFEEWSETDWLSKLALKKGRAETFVEQIVEDFEMLKPCWFYKKWQVIYVAW